MDIHEYTIKLQALADKKEEETFFRAVLPAAIKLRAIIQNRINRTGTNTVGGSMSSYSTKEAYYTKEQFVKKSMFKPIGQRGFKGERVVETYKLNKYNPKLKSFSRTPTKSVVKTEVKSMYLKNGYKELRDIQGRRTDITNLFYSGDLFKSFIVGKKSKSIQIGFDNEKQSLKRIGLEKKYGSKIFYASQKELLDYKQEVIEAYSELDKINPNG